MAVYRRPPIVEAVMEVQFAADPIQKKDLERFVKKVDRKYPQNERMEDYNFSLTVSNGVAKPDAALQSEWYKCFSKDGADIINIKPTTLVTARTAPYLSWEALFDSFREDFETLRKVAGYKRVSRIGTRYINRIDVPSPRSEPVDPRRYLNTYPSIPLDPYPILSANYLNFQYQTPEGVSVIVHAGLADPVLINHTSLLLDIDVFISNDLPLKVESVLELFGKLREVKNRLFEALVTAEGKSLFNA